jgi:hypothetical protein
MHIMKCKRSFYESCDSRIFNNEPVASAWCK